MRFEKTKNIEVCEVCFRETTLYGMKCIVCGREYCLTCEGHGNNYFRQAICRDCIECEEVEKILDTQSKIYNEGKEAQKKDLSEIDGGGRLEASRLKIKNMYDFR